MSSVAMPTKSTQSDATDLGTLPYAILKTLGSLKITVTMFALGILIILFGTLAQDELDLVSVKREYFTCWLAYIPIDVLFPITLVPHDKPFLGGLGFYFPGGATIGLILLVNLICAKATRFSVFAKGGKLAAGIALSLVGTALIVAVIIGGHAANGLQGQPPISYDTLWMLLKGGCVVLTLALIVYAFVGKMPLVARVLIGLTTLIALVLSIMLLTGGESVRLDDPGLRIVWQLLQASIASLVALAGLWMVFGQRGGNVLIHAGVGLLMVGQFVFGDRQIEQRIALAEGTKTNLVFIEDQIEIALIDKSDPDEDVVYAVPDALIRRFDGSESLIDEESLPVKLKIVDYMRNSQLQDLGGDEAFENPATTGLGLQKRAVEIKPYGGAISDKMNIAAAYVQLVNRDNDQPIATLLLSQDENDKGQLFSGLLDDNREKVEIDGKPFEVAIRFRQERKPYYVELKDVERINYSGTDTPRDYSSVIEITDRESGESQQDKTWMNNPIRYRGETFYQSRYNRVPVGGGEVVETTGLQVVENAGWVIPYVCCMMVFWGMFAHFGGTFFRFARRYQREAIERFSEDHGNSLYRRSLSVFAGLFVTCVVTAYFATPKRYGVNEVNWNEIQSLPVQHEGRIKSFDSVARNTLQRLSEPVFGLTPSPKDAEGTKHSATEWLLAVMADEDWAKDAEVFRVYSTEAQTFMDLDPDREKSRYTYNELNVNRGKLEEAVKPLRGKEADNFTFREQKLAKLHSKLNAFDLIRFSYLEPNMPDPSGVESEEERQRFFAALMGRMEMMSELERGGPPGVVPPTGEATEENLVDARWQAYGPAKFKSLLSGLLSLEKNDAVESFSEILTAYKSGDAKATNNAVRKHKRIVDDLPLAASSSAKASAESWLNLYNPTAQAFLLYLLATTLGFAGFLVRKDGFRRASFWLLVGVFVIHTIALLSRIYISGRAPVINLYSSAVFIGWACVLLALVMEVLYPIGIANLVAAVIGASTISVARFLDTSDTMHVLQAVLDTQFWLSTHVITVTAGYAVTFLAGFIGICALVHRIYTGYDAYPAGRRPKNLERSQKDMYSMCYGSICFAIFFSFIGTVLGGLWADDSWGRFWGWDPKENGAMMIVLWNALILHARWDKMVGARGFAALAVLGNVVTAWSWFGTNQLGIGLHSYGFTSGALIGLGGFILLNLLIVIAALMVTSSNSVARRVAENDGEAGMATAGE